MVHDKIMGVLLSLQEKATGPIQRVYEICLESMQKVEGEIKSVAELPEIPFTVPIKRKILAAMEPETDVEETNSPKLSKKRRRTRKKPKHGYMDSSSTSHNSSASSLPDTSRQRVKCNLCELWIEKYEMRQHKMGHQTNVTTSSSFRPSRRAKKKCHQMSDFEYYWLKNKCTSANFIFLGAQAFLSI